MMMRQERTHPLDALVTVVSFPDMRVGAVFNSSIQQYSKFQFWCSYGGHFRVEEKVRTDDFNNRPSVIEKAMNWEEQTHVS